MMKESIILVSPVLNGIINKRMILIILFSLMLSQSVSGQIISNWEYKNELIGYMQSPEDTVFIQNRKKLEKIGGRKCNRFFVSFRYKCRNGDSLFIKIESQKFNRSKHKLYLSDTVDKFIDNQKYINDLIVKNLIDGKEAFGIDGDIPTREISSIKIKWGETQLSIPDSSFHNLYETHLCLNYYPVEAYITNDGRFLYIYIPASDGAGGYAVKLVFDRAKYRTRIVNRNECSDGYDFLDAMAECE